MDQKNKNKEAVEYIIRALNIDQPERKKIVTIWGAGTSIASGIPGGYYLMERMVKDLRVIADTEIFKARFGANYSEVVESLQTLDNLSYEHVMSLYAKVYGTKRLHEWLKQYIPQQSYNASPPHFPSFAHEFCAHMVNNGYLSYFISLNFDEILEAAIEDEIGYGNFKTIASRDEFQRLDNKQLNEWEEEFGLPKPQCFVLKPHGTISRGRSLRHIPKRVQSFEKEKRQVLARVLKDSIVLFLGFGNYNEDFRLLFGETYSQGLTDNFLIVDMNPKPVAENMPGDRHTRQIYQYMGSVHEFFKEVSDHMYEGVDKRLSQKPTRHKIRTLFFDLFSKKLVDETDEQDYRNFHNKMQNVPPAWFDKRIYELELLIYLLKTRGLFIHLAPAQCHRVSTAYKKCIDHFIINGKVENFQPWKVLRDMLGEKTFGHSKVEYRPGKSALNTNWCFLKTQKTTCDIKKLGSEVCDGITEVYTEHLEKAIEVHVNDAIEITDQFKKEFSHNLEELYQDFDVDIKYNPDVSMKFKRPELLTSRKDLLKRTDSILQNNAYNRLRITTVSGEWLKEKADTIFSTRKTKTAYRIEIITNLDMFEGKDGTPPERLFHYRQMISSITEMINSLKDKRCTIAWHVYKNLENHMTIVDTKGNEEGEAIYFHRTGKNTTISPVYLNALADIKSLRDYFESLDSTTGEDDKDCGYTKEQIQGRLFLADFESDQKAITFYADSKIKWVSTFKKSLKRGVENIKITQK